MPTINPRVQVTLKPSLHAVIKRLSAVTGNSMSSLISEFLEPNEAVFVRMVMLIEAASTARDEVKKKIAEDMQAVQADIEGKLGLTLDIFESSTSNLLNEVEAVERRRRPPASRPASGRTPAKPVSPPSLTGGSGDPVKGTKPVRKSPSKARQVRQGGKSNG